MGGGNDAILPPALPAHAEPPLSGRAGRRSVKVGATDGYSAASGSASRRCGTSATPSRSGAWP